MRYRYGFNVEWFRYTVDTYEYLGTSATYTVMSKTYVEVVSTGLNDARERAINLVPSPRKRTLEVRATLTSIVEA